MGVLVLGLGLTVASNFSPWWTYHHVDYGLDDAAAYKEVLGQDIGRDANWAENALWLATLAWILSIVAQILSSRHWAWRVLSGVGALVAAMLCAFALVAAGEFVTEVERCEDCVDQSYATDGVAAAGLAALVGLVYAVAVGGRRLVPRMFALRPPRLPGRLGGLLLVGLVLMSAFSDWWVAGVTPFSSSRQPVSVSASPFHPAGLESVLPGSGPALEELQVTVAAILLLAAAYAAPLFVPWRRMEFVRWQPLPLVGVGVLASWSLAWAVGLQVNKRGCQETCQIFADVSFGFFWMLAVLLVTLVLLAIRLVQVWVGPARPRRRCGPARTRVRDFPRQTKPAAF